MSIQELHPLPDSLPLDDLNRGEKYLVELREWAGTSRRIFIGMFIEFQSIRGQPLSMVFGFPGDRFLCVWRTQVERIYRHSVAPGN